MQYRICTTTPDLKPLGRLIRNSKIDACTEKWAFITQLSPQPYYSALFGVFHMTIHAIKVTTQALQHAYTSPKERRSTLVIFAPFQSFLRSRHHNHAYKA